MAPHTVDVSEFRGDLSAYLLESQAPVSITREGDTVGVYYPATLRRSPMHGQAAAQAHARLQADMMAHNVTEDDILADFARLRRG